MIEISENEFFQLYRLGGGSLCVDLLELNKKYILYRERIQTPVNKYYKGIATLFFIDEYPIPFEDRSSYEFKVYNGPGGHSSVGLHRLTKNDTWFCRKIT